MRALALLRRDLSELDGDILHVWLSADDVGGLDKEHTNRARDLVRHLDLLEVGRARDLNQVISPVVALVHEQSVGDVDCTVASLFRTDEQRPLDQSICLCKARVGDLIDYLRQVGAIGYPSGRPRRRKTVVISGEGMDSGYHVVLVSAHQAIGLVERKVLNIASV